MDSRTALGADGPVAGLLSGFAPRESQLELSEQIELAISRQTDLVTEAGTGTGKTLAYLVPALISGKRLLLSTGTKTLQDQLFFRDLPLVIKALGLSRKTALLKGRNNYLCLYRMQQTRSAGLLNSRESVDLLEQLAAWSAKTVDGDLSISDVIPDDSPLWPQVTSTTDNCLGSDCPLYDDCFVLKARRKAQGAEVVVVNHHLLFADMVIKQGGFGEILPTAEVVVMDEAHLAPDIATGFFSVSFSSHQVNNLFRDTLRDAALVKAGLATLRPALENCRESLLQAVSAVHELPGRGTWQQLHDHQGAFAALEKLAAAIAQLDAALAVLEGTDAGLDSCRNRASLLLERWQQIIAAEEPDNVTWYEHRGRGFIIHITPLDVAGLVAEYKQSMEANWIFTSATLTVRNKFDHYQQQMGLGEAATFLAEGVFDYARNACIWLPQDLPEPGSMEFIPQLLEAVIPVIEANNGRAFLLFTSHRALQRAAEWLADRSDFPLFVQGQASRTRLLQRFRESGNGLLLGAASFWEGVDVPGPALSLVIIDKLPFAPPDDPVLVARLAAARERGHNPFQSIQLPQAVIALKQGAGRLIRAVDDRGVLILGDPRLRTKSYGRVFLESLPPMAKTVDRERAIAHLLREGGPVGD